MLHRLGERVAGGTGHVVDRPCRHVVVEEPAVADMGQAVPLGRRLQAHHHHVVGGDHAVGCSGRVRRQERHDVDRVDPKPSGQKRAVLVEGHAEVEVLPRPHQLRGLHTLFRGDEVEGADLVIVAPSPPVAQRPAELVMGPRLRILAHCPSRPAMDSRAPRRASTDRMGETLARRARRGKGGRSSRCLLTPASDPIPELSLQDLS